MKPLAIIALATTAIVGGSSFAGEQLTSFDGVGSMVLDMADEPTQMADLSPVASSEHSGGQCEESQQALNARIEGMYAEFEHSFKISEAMITEFDVNKVEARIEAAIAPFAMTAPEMQAVETRVVANTNVQNMRREALAEAHATIEKRRHELKARIADVKSQQSRKALMQAEKALKRAQEALHH
ncbi:hypothetical protein [Kordiimonas sp.]|uniref:hypothetical protein n=1 Tax=Kordiimonas sp. TaxID=1970157 RepID=UPI003A90F448